MTVMPERVSDRPDVELMHAGMCRLSFVERNRRAARGEPLEEEQEEDAIQDPEAATQHDSGAPDLSLRLDLPADDAPGSSRWVLLCIKNLDNSPDI